MQNNIMLLKQTFNNTIQNIDKTLGTNLLSKLSKKTMFIISAIIAGSIASLKVIVTLEQIFAYRKFSYNPNIEASFRDIATLSRIKFNKLNKFSTDNFSVDLEGEDYIAKYINVHLLCTESNYPSILALYDAKDDVKNPLYGKDFYDVKQINSSDSLFKDMQDCKIKKYKWKSVIVLEKESFNNKLLDMAKAHFNDNNYEVSSFSERRLSILMKEKDFKENVVKLGFLKSSVYVANKKDSLKKYSEYIEKSIKPKTD